MISVQTYWANIYVGLCPGYNTRLYNPEASLFTIHGECQNYCNKVKLGLTITNTKFIYVNGSEDGVIIGLINYPRFPSTPEQIQEKAIELASILKEKLKQERVSVVFPDKTIMLGGI